MVTRHLGLSHSGRSHDRRLRSIAEQDRSAARGGAPGDPAAGTRRLPVTELDELEARSVFLLREAYAAFKQLCMLWSIGKDSTVLLWLTRKAFFGHVPFPLVHIDTSFKIPEMIAYRDRLAAGGTCRSSTARTKPPWRPDRRSRRARSIG